MCVRALQGLGGVGTPRRWSSQRLECLTRRRSMCWQPQMPVPSTGPHSHTRQLTAATVRSPKRCNTHRLRCSKHPCARGGSKWRRCLPQTHHPPSIGMRDCPRLESCQESSTSQAPGCQRELGMPQMLEWCSQRLTAQAAMPQSQSHFLHNSNSGRRCWNAHGILEDIKQK